MVSLMKAGSVMNMKIWIPLLVITGSFACAAQPKIQTEISKNRVDEILTDLQKRGDGLKDIRTQLRFVEDDRINLTKRTKIGSLMFMAAEPNPLFMVHFEKTVVDDIVGKREWYLFDGQWLHEVVERLQQVTKREIVRPGEKINLFDLEHTPFPMPFGQKKETIKRNFDVVLLAPTANDPPNTDHLVCTPRPESKFYSRYEKLEFFVHQTIHLPTRIIITKNDALEVNTADFPDLTEKSINTGMKTKNFKKLREWRKYKVVEEAQN